MAPSSEPQGRSTNCHPIHERACTNPPECHQLQIARAQLGDTKGAVFLPVDDSPPSSPGLSSVVSIFSTSNMSRAASPASDTQEPLIAATYARSNPKRRRLTSPSSPVVCCSNFNELTNQNMSTVASDIRKPLQRTTRADGACEGERIEGQNNTQRRRSTHHNQEGSSETIKVRFAPNQDMQRKYLYNRKKSFSAQFSDPFAGFSDSDERRFSESSASSAYLRPNAFAGHRDTLARLHQSPNDDLENAAHEHKLVNEDRIGSLSVCSSLPLGARMPAEILHQIYQHLQPCDFDAAKHTCRSWFLASLDRRIGRQMLKSAGCTPAFAADLEHRQQVLHAQQLEKLNRSPQYHTSFDATDRNNEIEENFSEEWIMSKRLATECRLSAAWHGSGISKSSGHSLSRFTPTEAVSFEKLAFPSEDQVLRIKRFTVSVCGKFLLVIVGTDVFVYSVNSRGSALKPCVRLVAGKEILSVSMDTSSGRYAVAALLSGRSGMCWELKDIFKQSKKSGFSGEPISLGLETDVYCSAPPTTQSVIPLSLPTRRDEYSLTLDGNTNPERQSYFNLGSASNSLYASPLRSLSEEALDDQETKGLETLSTVPIRTKPTHIYKNLGCPADEPRSVAICPQRKCVAFGCRAGIELHWVDALTGRDLNRWFPLAAPSDHLYFLPPRPAIDTAKKLRLISSAAGPLRKCSGRHNSTPTDSKFSSTGRLHGRYQSMTRLFYGDLPFPSGLDNVGHRPGYITEEDNEGVLRTVDCDHYNAIPLSDGVHMLFTDPTTGFLCLGSDAPVGGPTKLIRKVCMIPPASDKVSIGSLSCYAVARNLSWGIRVVAAYDDGSIILFNIPSDCFERLRHIRSSTDVWDELTGVLGESDVLMDAFMLNQRRHRTGTDSTADTPTPSSPSSFRSLQINGAFICRTDQDVEDLQVDCEGGGLRLWIFHRSGQARRMDIYAPRNDRPDSYVVGVDGLLHVQPESSATEACGNISGDLGKTREQLSKDECDPKKSPTLFGYDGACDYHTHCDTKNFEDDLKLLEDLNTQSITLYPDAIMTPPIEDRGRDNALRLQLEVLTDWRDTVLLDPYLISLD